ncbi:hypothetical protein Hdeb2414_s0026g00678811 [Helianthus debilis subsp. tardiflorus]
MKKVTRGEQIRPGTGTEFTEPDAFSVPIRYPLLTFSVPFRYRSGTVLVRYRYLPILPLKYRYRTGTEPNRVYSVPVPDGTKLIPKGHQHKWANQIDACLLLAF